MPIGPGQIAPTIARLKLGRVGAMRLRYAPLPLGGSVVIGNVDQTRRIRMGTVTIQDILNDTPNTCSFIANYQPTAGQDIRLNWPPGTVLFAGAIERVEQFYEGDRPANAAWRVTCQDYSRLLTRDVLNKTYSEQSATSIATDLIAGTGITSLGIVAGLPTVTGGIDFANTTPRDALTRLAQRIGAYWYVDYSRVLHFFIKETIAAPDPLLPTTATLQVDPPVTYEEDITQLRTRIIVVGGGSTTLIPIAAGASTIPVDDSTLFAEAPGTELKSDAIRFRHAAKVGGGFATNVGSSIATPSTAPSAAISATTVGKIVGVVSYKYTLKNASGETLASPASNAVTGIAFAAPAGAPGLSVASGLGRLVGVYTYRITNVTDRGETTPGPSSSAIAAAAVAPAGAVSISPNGIGPLVGFYQYACTFVTSLGETNAGSIGSRTASAVATPGGCSVSELSNTIGPLIGAYSYRVSFVTPTGETAPGNPASITLAAQAAPGAPSASTNLPGPLIGNYSYLVSFVSALGETLGSPTITFNCAVVTAAAPGVAGDGTGASIAYAVTITHAKYGESAMSARTIDTNKGTNPVVSFGSLSGCGWNCYSTGTTTDPANAPLFKVAELPPGVSSFTHTTQTGPQAGVNAAMGRWVQLSNIPVGPNGTTARRIYRTKAGGSQYYLVGQIDNNSSGQTFDDFADDTQLTIRTPAVNLNGKQVSLTFIPTGPSGTVARRIYRTKAGGSTYFLIGAIGDNSTSSYTDNTPDSAQTQNAPLSSSAGGESFSVSIPIGPSGTLARRVYRTIAGGSTFRLVAEIPDNGTTTIVDAVADAALSPVSIPITNTAGGQNIQLTSILPGPTGTLARRIYRTKAGGSEYLLAGQISDNVTQSFLDTLPDNSLGRLAPLVNDAGASAVNVTIPTGPSGTASRRLYRTEAGGNVYRFVTEIRDNTTTAFTDGKADAELGDLPPDVSTIGALAGATSLSVTDASGMASAGWARVDSQIIQWTSRTATVLQGIPSSGDGAIKSSISAGSGIVSLPMLIGVTNLTQPLIAGAPINLLVQRDDTAAQTALAAREGFGDGIIEYPIEDGALSATEAAARGDAELQLFARPIGRLKYASRDLKTASGKTIHVNLPSQGAALTNTDFTIQSVAITQIGIARDADPLFTVEASTVRLSLDDALRRLLRSMGGL